MPHLITDHHHIFCHNSGRKSPAASAARRHFVAARTEEGHELYQNVRLPPGAVGAFLIDIADLHAAVRRLFELSRSLPSAPLDRFHETTRSLPASTEVERLVVQRIGQDIFREALMDFWSGRCAVTGLDQPELLRASHMNAWDHRATARHGPLSTLTSGLFRGETVEACAERAFVCAFIHRNLVAETCLADRQRPLSPPAPPRT